MLIDDVVEVCAGRRGSDEDIYKNGRGGLWATQHAGGLCARARKSQRGQI